MVRLPFTSFIVQCGRIEAGIKIKGGNQMLSDYKWYRKLLGGHWYYLRPYDNLWFSVYMRYWTRRKPLKNEIVLKEERR